MASLMAKAKAKAKVNIDYHVAVDNHFYSVPYSLIHQQLDVRLTEQTVELFHDGKRVAAHHGCPASSPPWMSTGQNRISVTWNGRQAAWWNGRAASRNHPRPRANGL
jgi:hypothetical protein